MADAIPVISQFKSAVKACKGDKEGAKQTQINFTKRCVGVSQVRSMVEAAKGDMEGAKDTQEQFLEALPVVGHIKAHIHKKNGEEEKYERAKGIANETMGLALNGTGKLAKIAVSTLIGAEIKGD